MIDYIEEKHRHQYTGRTWVQINMYAHNSKGFDTWVVLRTSGIKFKNIIKTNSSLLWLSVLTPSCKLNFLCTLAHLSGWLSTLCKNFGLSDSNSKLSESTWGFGWEDVNEETWDNPDLLNKIIPYLTLDVISLREIWKKYILI